MPEIPYPSTAGVVAALWRHPVKGFTPEPLDAVDLPTGGWFPGDRMFAVEDGLSGFDRAAPQHLPKQNFTVLMRTAAVAGVRTRWDEASRRLHVGASGHADLAVTVDDPSSRAAFEVWLADVLGDAVSGPLRLVSAEGLDHRFMDHPLGRISLLNLARVRDFEARVGRPIDPRRFRANVWVEGWPAWIENEGGDRDLILTASIGVTIYDGNPVGAEDVLREYERRVSSDMPQAAVRIDARQTENGAEEATVAAPGVNIQAKGDDASVKLPGLQIETRGDSASVRIAGINIQSKDGEGVRTEKSSVKIDSNGETTQIRTQAPGDATRASFILADDDVPAGAWRQVGFEARGPAGGPLVIATVRSKSRHDRVFEAAKDLVALNVGD